MSSPDRVDRGLAGIPGDSRVTPGGFQDKNARLPRIEVWHASCWTPVAAPRHASSGCRHVVGDNDTRPRPATVQLISGGLQVRQACTKLLHNLEQLSRRVLLTTPSASKSTFWTDLS